MPFEGTPTTQPKLSVGDVMDKPTKDNKSAADVTADDKALRDELSQAFAKENSKLDGNEFPYGWGFQCGYDARDAEVAELRAKYNFMVDSAQQNAKERDELQAKLDLMKLNKEIETMSNTKDVYSGTKVMELYNAEVAKSQRLVEALIEIRDERKAFGASVARAARALRVFDETGQE